MARGRVASVAVLVLPVLACSAAPAEAPLAVAPSAAPSVAKEPLLRGPTVPWAVVFERECRASNTAPIVSPGQTVVGFCEGVFSFEEGRWLGSQPVGAEAYFAERAVISASSAGLGVEVDPLLGDGSIERRTLTSGWGRQVAVSPDRTRGVALLEEPSGDARLVSFRLPGLEAGDTAPFTGPVDHVRVGFLANGAAFVFGSGLCVQEPVACPDGDGSLDCVNTNCDARSVRTLASGKLVDAAPALQGALDVLVSRDGARALVQWEDGRRALVEMPGGAIVAELPKEADEDTAPMFGIADDGSRIAFIDDGKLVVAEIAGRDLVVLHRRPLEYAEALTFSPDAKTLFVKADIGMIALREGATPYVAQTPSYQPVPPPGFERTFGQQTPIAVARNHPKWEEINEILPLGMIARYRGGEDAEYLVNVIALDPRELGPADLDPAKWVNVAIARDGDEEEPAENVTSWRTAEGRSAEYSWLFRESCNPTDLYVRVSEKGGVLYRVEIEAPRGTSPATVAPLMQRFFDGPLGAPPAKRSLTTARRSKVRC
ncbi:MAG: hypothetical protein HOW73_01100 [Polyangiaceae bacterium]|nr:hypothetical protein [Polyangiaceae bacterium]